MSQRRIRERREQSLATRRRSAVVAGAVIVGVLAVIGLMYLGGGAKQNSASSGLAPADLVAAAALRPCPPQSDAAPGSATTLPVEAMPCLGGGPDFSLASLSGKPAIINVWGSWCPPCRDELPWFASLDHDASGKVQIIGVDVADTADSALSTLASLGVHYPSVFDPDGRTRVALQWTGGTPVTLLVRADGTIAHRIEGRVPDEQTLRALVTQHLGVALPQA